MVEDLGVVVAHDGQQRALGAGGNAVVLVDDLHPHAKPRAPGDPDILHVLGVDQIGGQRVAQQVGDGHLRMAVLHGPPHFAHRIAGQHAHQERAGGLAAAGAADKQAFPPRGKGQQRQQHETGIALRGGQGQAALAVAER